MRRYFALVHGSAFVRHATLMTFGSTLAQMVTLAMIPFYTRHFAADMFAIQALFIMGIGVAAPLATGNYDWALPTIRSDREARMLASSALGIAIFFTLVMLLVTILLRERIVRALHLHAAGDMIYVFPFLVFATAFNSITNYWLLRQGKLVLQTMNRASFPVLTALCTIPLGLMHEPRGLVLGFFLGIGGSMLCSVALAWRNGLRFDYHYTRHELRRELGRLKHFPLFSALPTALNNLAMQIPLLAISLHYSLTEAGHYALARGILFNGIAAVTLSIGQVVLKHVAERALEKQPVWPYYWRIMLGIGALGFVGAALTYALGPWFFRMYFGAGWEDSAEMTRILGISAFFWLVGPTLSYAAVAIHRMKAVALWQVMYCTLALGLLVSPVVAFDRFVHVIVAFEIAIYTMYVAMITYTIRRYTRQSNVSLSLQR